MNIATVQQIGEFVASALVTRLVGVSEDQRSRLESLDEVLSRYGARSLRHYPSWLALEPEAAVASHLNKLFISRSDKDVRDALSLVFEWYGYSRAGLIESPPESIVDNLFMMTVFAPGRAVSSAFATTCSLLVIDEGLLTARRTEWIRLSLERYIGHDLTPRPSDEPGKDAAAQQPDGDIRAAAARLLVLMSIREPNDQLWSTLLLNIEDDPYPEVRRAKELMLEELKSAQVP